MIKSMARRIGGTFVERAIIGEEDIGVYTHGLELMISEFISSTLVIVIGMLMGRTGEAVLYLITFTCIRVYAGGYHAGSYKNCITIFCVCAYVVFLLTGWMHQMKIPGLAVILLLIADIIIFLLAPVEDCHKRLDGQERRRYRSVSRKEVLISSILFLVVFYLFPSWRDEISYCMAAVFEIAVLLVIGYIKNMILIAGKQ